MAFCGIARQHGFFAGLRALEINVVGERAFRDHHAYSEADVQELQRMRESSGAAGFVTTEKDEINLADLASKLSPLSIVKLSISLDRREELLKTVANLTAGPKAAKS